MGSGKSTVGELLAERLDWRFLDLDRAIEERAGLAIEQVFDRFGEIAFRKLENEVLAGVAAGPERVVVALGGGAFVSDVNRSVVAASGVSVWLDVPVRVSLRRVGTGRGRPLAQSPSQMVRLYRSRLRFYHEADVRIRAGEAPPERIARAIVRLLQEDWPVAAERRCLEL